MASSNDPFTERRNLICLMAAQIAAGYAARGVPKASFNPVAEAVELMWQVDKHLGYSSSRPSAPKIPDPPPPKPEEDKNS